MGKPRTFAVGDRVVKDPAGWRPSESDGWGAGEGVGVVVAVIAGAGPEEGLGPYDVRWPAGRAYQRGSELLPAPEGAGGADEGPSGASSPPLEFGPY